jgi:hypothetical protein
MSIVGVETTLFVSEEYSYHAFNCLGYLKQYADSGTRTNVVSFFMLLLTGIQLHELHKEICRWWETHERS